jgi:hypothetical protein
VPTVAEIVTQAQLQSEETYDNATWIRYINAALDDLTPVVKLLKKKEDIAVTVAGGKATIVIADDDDLAQGHEFLHVYFTPTGGSMRQLRRLPISDNVSEGWKLTATEVLLQGLSSASGTVRVDYYQKLQHVNTTAEDLETTSGLPSQYVQLVVLYCVAKSQQKEEELDDKADAYNEYLIGKRQLAIDRMWLMEPHMRKLIKRTRVAALLGVPVAGQEQ